MIAITQRADLDQGVKKTFFDQVFAAQDNKAHRIDVQLHRGAAQAQLEEGTTIKGFFIRYSDNATVLLKGSLSGNVASVTLSEACYHKPGAFAVIVKAIQGEEISTIFYGEGSVFISSTDIIVDEEDIIPSLEELLAMCDEMEVLLGHARAWENATASTTTLAPGSLATVSVQEVNGVRSFAFGIPRGYTGATGPVGPTGPQGKQGPAGADGKNFTVLGLYATLDALKAAHATGSEGDAYCVGTSTSNVVYLWDTGTKAWVNVGALQGPQGPAGPAGAQGKTGAAGHTPQRGVDYWTSQDVAEMKAYIDNAILGGEW